MIIFNYVSKIKFKYKLLYHYIENVHICPYLRIIYCFIFKHVLQCKYVGVLYNLMLIWSSLNFVFFFSISFFWIASSFQRLLHNIKSTKKTYTYIYIYLSVLTPSPQPLTFRDPIRKGHVCNVWLGMRIVSIAVSIWIIFKYLSIKIKLQW